MVNLTRIQTHPPIPPPPPKFGAIPSRFPRNLIRLNKSQPLPTTQPPLLPPRSQPPRPPPPPLTPYGPILPLRHLIITRKKKNVYRKYMLTWYLLTLMIRQKLQTRNQKPEETREEWVISIKGKMEQALRDDAETNWDKLCIYRVTHYLQENDKKSYFPQTVSLGPYHHGKEHLLPMEHHKCRAFNMVMKRTNQHIEMYVDAMKELEEKARACYEGPIGLSSNKFTEMLVLDGCFVLELFRGADTDKGFSKLGYGRNDPVFAMRGSMHSIQRDMVMLENQLPLFVLDRLLELELGTQYQTGLVAQLAIRFFNPLMPTDTLSIKINKVKPENSLENDNFFNPIADKELHCLDIFRRSLLQPSQKPEPRLSRTKWSWKRRVADKRQQQLIHCVTDLRVAGIKFKRRETDRFWDIRFENGYLEIPKLLIHDGTKSLFSNLIAFEQCHIDSSNDITSYVIFMDNLVDSAEDVSYLHYCGIIEHWLGNDSEVADLFNRLCQEFAFDLEHSYLSQLSNNVNRNYNRKWIVLKATLKHKYFNNPWAYFSFFAAVCLLILTFFQSFFTAYAYFKPPS